MPQSFHSATELADAVVACVGKEIVLGLPVGIGKAVHVANALYERALADPSIRLTIFTALTLEVPQPSSGIEKRFLEPLSERLFAEWPSLAYAEALRRRELPPNIQVREFYFRPGSYLANPIAQRCYTSINYSQVVQELLEMGVNVVAQLVSARRQSPGRLSLSSNPEVTLDLLSRLETAPFAGRKIAIVGQVNRELPYMVGDAELPEDRFDFILDAPASDYPLFGIPSRSVGPADYAAGMHVASLIPDGGTIQLGIGSLSDAVSHCLWLRHESPEIFAEVLRQLPGGSGSPGRASLPLEIRPFREGLYASSELVSDALFSLFEREIISRPADERDATVMHGGFFVGSSRLYAALRELDETRRGLINMTRISFVNTLFGEEARKRRQRRKARFVNETMMATLLGAAVSDALDDGRVVSGVGGQFDFVSMAHALADGMSILVLRATRSRAGRPESNIRWSYGHATVPRHHRDVFVSEYGIAPTRGQPDHRVIEAMLGIADARFQEELLAAARQAAKVTGDYRMAEEWRRNRPEVLRGIFDRPDIAPYFPAYPFGTDLTPAEQELAEALTLMKERTARRLDSVRWILGCLFRRPRPEHEDALGRLGLEEPRGLMERILRRMVARALEEAA